MRQWLFLLVLIALAPAWLWAQGYNEVFDENKNVRPHYREIYELWKQRYSHKEDEFLADSKKAFQGDNPLDPLPRLIVESDYNVVKKGAEQRARALLAFLKDHYSGKKTYATRGVIPEEVVTRIMARNGELDYLGKINPDAISFLYGPDVIRDVKGQWRVVEDNLGYVGGTGDIKLAHAVMMKTYPELGRYSPRRPDEFFKKLVESYFQKAAQYGGKPVFFTIPRLAADNEDSRLSKIFAELGIETVTPSAYEKFLSFEKDGVYLNKLTTAGLGKEKVGFIFVNGEHAWMDPLHPISKKKNLVDKASDVLRGQEKLDAKLYKEISGALQNLDPATHSPDFKRLERLMTKVDYAVDEMMGARMSGFLDSIIKNKVATNYTPGVDFVGDKEFYFHVEDLIRFYLKEEPILRNIETYKVANKDHQADEVLLKKVFGNISNYVLKQVDGRGGDSVWVGPKINVSDLPGIEERLRKNPDHFVIQKFTHPSEANGKILDIRMLLAISNQGVITSDSPMGRGVSKSGNGKVNISDSGSEFVVLVLGSSTPQPLRCEAAFGR